MAKAFAFIRVALRETERIARDRFSRTLLVFLPLGVFTFLGFIYIGGAMRDIPVAVYDADHSVVSREVVSMIKSSAAMKITDYLSSEDDLRKYFLTHDEHAVFYIPAGFARDIYRNRSTRLVVYTNSSNIVFGNILFREAAVIAGTVSAGATISRLEHAGIDQPTTMALVMPVETHVKALFNPWFNYLYYLLPGLMTVLLQMFIFFVATKAFNTEINEGTFGELMETSGGSPFQMLLGKSLAYLMYGLGIVMLIALIFQAFGNHPSFVMFTLGNELGRRPAMFDLVAHFKEIDPRHLYAQGSNNMHWNPSLAEGDDFWVTCKTGKDLPAIRGRPHAGHKSHSYQPIHDPCNRGGALPRHIGEFPHFHLLSLIVSGNLIQYDKLRQSQTIRREPSKKQPALEPRQTSHHVLQLLDGILHIVPARHEILPRKVVCERNSTGRKYLAI